VNPPHRPHRPRGFHHASHPHGPRTDDPARRRGGSSTNDGYGLGDCLASGNDCGRIVANAWCETQGFARAASFGLAQAEEFTGALEISFTETARPISITCAR
jgi:hypothetical protein